HGRAVRDHAGRGGARAVEGLTMRFAPVLALLFVTTASRGAENPPTATRVIEGKKTTFPVKTVAEGVKVAIAALESCHSTAWMGGRPPTLQDLEQAWKGDHVRFVFAKPIMVSVLGDKIEITELVYSEKVGFLVRSGDKVVRGTKYEHDKMDRFR